MKKVTLAFYECEHSEDLRYYVNDIVECGGRVVKSHVEYDDEIGIVECTIGDDFWDCFKKTRAYEFLY